MWFICWVLLSKLVMSQKLPTEEPIIKMIPHCPTSKSQNTLIQLKTDVPVVVEVHCRYGRVFNMETIDSVTYGLEATFSDVGNTSICAFQKKTATDVYVLPVNVLWGDGKGEVLKFWHRAILTCGFDPHGSDTSAIQHMTEITLPLKENQRNKGPLSDAQFEVMLLDVLGNPVEGLPVGRKTQLKAVMTAPKDVLGFRVTSCHAIGISSQTNITYGILRGGCGDGKVFSKAVGFLTEGFVAHSPYFQAFRLMGSNLLTFECNFTICRSNCDGDSCGLDLTSRQRVVRSLPNREEEERFFSDELNQNEHVFTARTGVISASDNIAVNPGPHHFQSLVGNHKDFRRRH